VLLDAAERFGRLVAVSVEDSPLDRDHLIVKALDLLIILAAAILGLTQGEPVAEQLGGAHG